MADLEAFAQQPAPPEQGSDKKSAGGGAFRNKRIIVCCDGTGNEFAVKDSPNSNSNVVRIYTALNLDKDQIGYYHPGVGTMGDPTRDGLARQWSRIKGLAFGSGFQENVLDAYRYLMQHYNSGDSVFLFGFSRGAYTARALAGLLHGYGLLCRGNEGHLLYAWRMYTAKVNDQAQSNNKRTIETDFSFRDTFSHKDFIIHFVGLWDTVSSVGWITSPLKLLHLAENPSIEVGRHAVSIDERRCFYQDNLWGKPVQVQVPPVLQHTPRGQAMDKIQDLVQVWFSGVHSDVGGSYPQLTSGLANITLEWMMGEAEKAGATFDRARRSAVLGGPIVQDPYNLTVELAPLYEKPKSSKLHKSLTWAWCPLEIFPHRYYDKDDADVSMRIPLGVHRRLPPHAIVHPTVKHRMEQSVCYRPPNVTLNEIQKPAVNPAPTDADLLGFLQFEPAVCREQDWRANWLVVFLVTMLEIALGLFLLVRLLGWLARLLVHTVRGVDWLVRHRHWLASVAQQHLAPRTWWTLDHLWPVLLAACIVMVRVVVAKARQVA